MIVNTYTVKVLIIKIIKFGLVGFTGIIIDFAITFLLKEKIKIQKYFANSIGFIVAATNNYFLNRIWTFNSHDPLIGLQYTKFIIISITGLGINNLVIWLLNDKILKINFYFAKVVAIIIVFFWNFTLNYLYTFSK
jgi:putative flippase GtrA